MAMNYARFQAAYRGLNTVAQKVYAAVPAQSAWTHTQIVNEIHRSGSNTEFRIVQGCINGLIKAGLVIESPGGHFVRCEVRGKPTKPLHTQEEESKDTPMATSAPLSLPKSPIEMLGTLAEKARLMSKQTAALASEIDDASLAVLDYIEHNDADNAKLKQLKQLLSSLA